MTVRSLRRTLAALQFGRSDRTTRITGNSFLHATYTPLGPGTLHLTWRDDPATPSGCGLDGEAWGPGGPWLLGQAAAMTGLDDPPLDVLTVFPDADPVVVAALRANRARRMAASRNLFHLLVPTIVAQRITGGEAIRQWLRLTDRLGEPAPGPPEIVHGMFLPPTPRSLAGRPAWWFHPIGIETKRARALSEMARHADKFWDWCAAGSGEVARKLELIHGVGPWTSGSVIGPALGDPDAVPIGDFHFPDVVAWNLAGEPRGDDDRMLELLAPYAGERGRVLHALVAAGRRPPAFGPRRRTLPIRHL